MSHSWLAILLEIMRPLLDCSFLIVVHSCDPTISCFKAKRTFSSRQDGHSYLELVPTDWDIVVLVSSAHFEVPCRQHAFQTGPHKAVCRDSFLQGAPSRECLLVVPHLETSEYVFTSCEDEKNVLSGASTDVFHWYGTTKHPANESSSERSETRRILFIPSGSGHLSSSHTTSPTTQNNTNKKANTHTGRRASAELKNKQNGLALCQPHVAHPMSRCASATDKEKRTGLRKWA